MRPARILQETAILDHGGVESLLMNIYRRIDRTKIQFDFLVHRPEPGAFEREIEDLGGRVYRTPPFRPNQYTTFMRSNEALFIAHPEWRVFHAHSDLNLWPLIAATRAGAPTRIAHSHLANPAPSVKWALMRYSRMFVHRYCTDRFMCSAAAGEWAFGRGAVQSGEVQWIRNGIDTGAFAFCESSRAAVRRELSLGNRPIFGHVGRFTEQKNHGFLIEVFAAVRRRLPDAALLLAGEGSGRSEAKRKADKLGLNDSVFFLGLRDDIAALMSAMDVFLLPSRWEGLPLVGIEAQASGLPLVVSDVITKELSLTGLVRRMPLRAGAEAWAEAAIRLLGIERKNNSARVAELGYDIGQTARWLEAFYLERHNRAARER